MQNHTAQLTRALDRLGVRQTVVTSRPPTAPAYERYAESARVLRLSVPVRRNRGLYAPLAGLVAPALAARADLVHLHLMSDLGMVPVAALAARAHRLPLVVTLHCSLRHSLLVDSDYAARLRDYGGAVEGWTVRRADAVITLTRRLADRLGAEGVSDAKLHVVPSGVDPARFGPPAADGGPPPPDPFPHVGRPRIAYVGRLDPEKDVRTAVAALPLLKAAGAHLLVIGDGGERAALEKQAADLGVADRVWTPGFLPHSAVPAALAHADVVVMPSLFEELGTSLVEALWAGKPVVASRVGGIPEVLRADEPEQAGLLVEPGRPAAFAAATDRVLSDPGLAARLSEAARRRAADFAWPQLARRVLDVYQRAAGGG